VKKQLLKAPNTTLELNEANGTDPHFFKTHIGGKRRRNQNTRWKPRQKEKALAAVG
jgi:hypothetical protein